MKKVQTGKAIVDLGDQPIVMSPQDRSPLTVGRAIALIFQNYKGKKFDALKCLELARSFYKKESVSLDKSDFKNVREIINEDQQFGPLIRGQILETLDESPDEEAGDK